MEYKEISSDKNLKRDAPTPYHRKILWKNVLLLGFIHVASLFALVKVTQFKLLTCIWAYITLGLGGLGITAGVHRLWTHRSYKARLPLRIFLAACNSMALQNSILHWSRDHRTHHKYSDTEADPHNSSRGFFFSHVGWLLVKKHPKVIEKGKSINLDDLYNDPVVMFQQKYYVASAILMCFVLPTFVPMYFWGETFTNAYLSAVLRYCLGLNFTWLVNSAAHMWGNKPYDRNIKPKENKFVVFAAMGEGFHNYHHVFPHDYATSEFGVRFNLTTAFIDLMAWFGQAYNRRTIPLGVVRARKVRTGE